MSDHPIQSPYEQGLENDPRMDANQDQPMTATPPVPAHDTAVLGEALAATRWQASNSGEWFCAACDDWVEECESGDCAMGKVRTLLFGTASLSSAAVAVDEGRQA